MEGEQRRHLPVADTLSAGWGVVHVRRCDQSFQHAVINRFRTCVVSGFLDETVSGCISEGLILRLKGQLTLILLNADVFRQVKSR